MTIQEKYHRARPSIRSGDIVLFRGKRLLARLIQYFDNAYYNHAGVVFESAGRLMIMDSGRRGVEPEFLSERMNEYSDFCILSPLQPRPIVDAALRRAFERGDERTKYDFFMLPRIAMAKKLKVDFLAWGSDKRDTCAEFARFYTICLGLETYSTQNIPLISPQDFLRYRKADELAVYFDNSRTNPVK